MEPAEPTSAVTTTREAGAARQRAEPWLPIIPPQRRRTLWQLHQQLAAEWSQQLRDYLHRGEQFTFCGFGFETFGQLAAGAGAQSISTVFTCDSSQVAGLMIMNPQLTRYLVQTRLGQSTSAHQLRGTGEQSGPAGGAPSKMAEDGEGEGPPDGQGSFTRLERAVLRKANDALLQRLAATYAAAGAGIVEPTRRGEQLENLLLFAPENYLLVFVYRVGGADSPVALTVATAVDLIKAVKDPISRGGLAAGNEVRTAVTATPLHLELVLGTWNATLAELLGLKPGDEIILPDGTEAWLSARGIRVRRVMARLSEEKIVLEPAGVADERG